MNAVFTPKYVTILTGLLAVAGMMYRPTSEGTIVILSLLIAAWLAITVHELGHVIFGMRVDYEFAFFTTGPLLIEKTKRGVQLKENKNWLSVGGMAVMMPPIVEKEKMINKSIIYSAGGPAFSLVCGLLSFVLYDQFASIFFLYFALMNAGIFLVTLIPSKGGMGSDGYIIFSLLRKNSDSLKLIENMIINKELFSKKNPTDWNTEYIQLAKQKKPSISNFLSGIMVYYYEIEKNGFHAAKEAVAGYTTIPVTKNNSGQLGIFIHMQQLAHFLTDNVEPEKMNDLQQFLSPIEPISFHRGQAMIACLKNDKQKALEHIQKVNKIIEESEHFYGFFKAEKTLTKLVEEKILKHQIEGKNTTGSV